jgi:hypothetical protein
MNGSLGILTNGSAWIRISWGTNKWWIFVKRILMFPKWWCKWEKWKQLLQLSLMITRKNQFKQKKYFMIEVSYTNNMDQMEKLNLRNAKLTTSFLNTWTTLRSIKITWKRRFSKRWNTTYWIKVIGKSKILWLLTQIKYSLGKISGLRKKMKLNGNISKVRNKSSVIN